MKIRASYKIAQQVTGRSIPSQDVPAVRGWQRELLAPFIWRNPVTRQPVPLTGNLLKAYIVASARLWLRTGEIRPTLPSWNAVTPTAATWDSETPDFATWAAQTPDSPTWTIETPTSGGWI